MLVRFGSRSAVCAHTRVFNQDIANHGHLLSHCFRTFGQPVNRVAAVKMHISAVGLAPIFLEFQPEAACIYIN